jgi:hypothetical protein
MGRKIEERARKGIFFFVFVVISVLRPHSLKKLDHLLIRRLQIYFGMGSADVSLGRTCQAVLQMISDEVQINVDQVEESSNEIDKNCSEYSQFVGIDNPRRIKTSLPRWLFTTTHINRDANRHSQELYILKVAVHVDARANSEIQIQRSLRP